MEFTEQDVEKLAKLARIKLTEKEKGAFSKQLSSILEYVDQIQEVDTSSIDSDEKHLRGTDTLRKDIVSQKDVQAEIIAHFPKKLGNLNKVKPVLGSNGHGH